MYKRQIKLGLVNIEEMKHLRLIKDSLSFVRANFTNLNDDLLRKALVHRLLNFQVTCLLSHCAAELKRHQFQSAEEAMTSGFRLGHATEIRQQKEELEKFLYERVYRHPQLVEIRNQAQARVKQMFATYCRRPDLFPKKYQARAEQIGTPRMAVEYIAGMTDKFFEDTFHRTHSTDS